MPVEIQKVVSFSIWYSYLGDWEMVVVMLVGGKEKVRLTFF
jgi:hypothetical protein